MRVVLVGSGQLAQSIARRCSKERIPIQYWEKHTDWKSVVLYAGSQRHAAAVSKFCRKTNSSLVLLSTDVTFPKKAAFPFYIVPNSSLEVREFVDTVLSYAERADYSKVSIIESHQNTKKDVSGTARFIAQELGESLKIITSVRTSKQQLLLGIPRKHLSGHAYHKITFTQDGLTTEFAVLVLGRETYAKGAVEIAKRVAAGTFRS